jgi:predicted phosphoribosyltransferase
MMFEDRIEAGRLLADKLLPFKGKNIIVLAIPRGGVVIGRAMADILECPLDVLVVKKLSAPYNPELAIGAVASGGMVYWDRDLIKGTGVEGEYKKKELRIKNYELAERERFLRREKEKIDVSGKIVILTDDGVATGATVYAAIKALRKMKPAELILAVPVVAADTVQKLKHEVDKIIFLDAPEDFHAVGQFYKIFDQVSDDEILTLLRSVALKL